MLFYIAWEFRISVSGKCKLICKYFNNDIEKITHATAEELVKIDGIGDKMAVKFVEYFSDKGKY